jgi:hypothetical protein
MKKVYSLQHTVYLLLVSSLFTSGCAMANNDQTAEFLNNHPLLNRNRIVDFKKTINFDQKILVEEKRFFVKTDWQNFLKSAGLVDWKIINQNKSISPAGRTKGFYEYDFQLSKNDQLIFIKIIDALKPSAAQDVFLRRLNETSMPEIFHKASAELIGTVSVEESNPAEKLNSYIWIYKNIFFEVSSKNVSDLLAHIKAIQRHAETNLVEN